MKEAGLYKRHSTKNPILEGFASYLQNMLGVNRFHREVENVARFMYFMDAEKVRLGFVKNIERVHLFFSQLKKICDKPDNLQLSKTYQKVRFLSNERYSNIMNTVKTPPECRRLLEVAKQSFIECLGNVMKGKMNTHITLTITYYLEALLILKHLQKLGVVQNRTVS
ncbi:hypothetical protein GDO86_018470 [Hymenochirus boettgeri]|uniref:Uncharacterized protein n=1 Tax=Hymenochirus boettgeri TaxID=247094 RepID=A0A8T2IC08_9PIPI|nr:hypothetical protein GDO86_018470 [Hymenochirus boettgeri]